MEKASLGGPWQQAAHDVAGFRALLVVDAAFEVLAHGHSGVQPEAGLADAGDEGRDLPVQEVTWGWLLSRDGFVPVLAEFFSQSSEANNGELGGEPALEGLYPAADMAEVVHGLILLFGRTGRKFGFSVQFRAFPFTSALGCG